MTPQQTASEISTAYFRGVPVRTIKEELGVGQGTITNVTENASYSPGRGRPLKVTPEIRRFMETNWLADARVSDDQMRVRVEAKYGARISRQTLCHTRKDLGFKWRPPIHVQPVDDRQRCSRVWGFGEYRRRRGLPEGDPEKIGIVVFSDESRFCRGNDNRWVRVRRGQWNDTATVQDEKFPVGVMVWAAIGPDNFRVIERCDLKIDGPEYMSMIQRSRLAELANEKYGAGNWYFMQDGAPSHTARKTVEQLQEEMRVLEGWPPQSPDANPIEMIWSIIGGKLASTDWSAEEGRGLEAVKNKLWGLVEQTFNDLSPDTINSLCRSFDDRLGLILQCNGKSVSQLLSSHKRAPRGPDDIAPAVPAGYTAEDDVFLMQAIRRAKKTIPYTRLQSNQRWEGRDHLKDKCLLKWRVTYLRMTEVNREFRPELGAAPPPALPPALAEGLLQLAPDDPEPEDEEELALQEPLEPALAPFEPPGPFQAPAPFHLPEEEEGIIAIYRPEVRVVDAEVEPPAGAQEDGADANVGPQIVAPEDAGNLLRELFIRMQAFPQEQMEVTGALRDLLDRLRAAPGA
jgi:transposase